MEGVRDDFYVEDESSEEARQAWRRGTPVLVIPSSLRRLFRERLARLLRAVADDIGHAADHVGTPARSAGRERGSSRTLSK